MKAKTKILLTSLMSVAFASSLIVGATYALFTSEAKVNIAVTSGTVKVDAKVNKASLVLTSMGEIQEGTTWANGGMASFTEEDELKLDYITPGDKATFTIDVTNESNVNIKYRTVLTADDDELLAGLAVTIGEDVITPDNLTVISSWKNLDAGKTLEPINVSIELPEDAGDAYQGKTANISFAVEAVQGNVKTYDGAAKINETAFATIQEALDEAVEGDVVEILNPGVYAPFTINTKNVTVKGIMGETKRESTVIRTTGTNKIKMYADNSTIDSLWIDVKAGADSNDKRSWVYKVGAIDAYISYNAGVVANDITITDCKLFGNNYLDYGILFSNRNITFTNNYVDGFAAAISSMCDNSNAESYVITGNTLSNTDLLIDGYWGTEYNGESANLTITDNKSEDSMLIRLWDYAHTCNKEGSALNAVVKRNTNATLMITETSEKTLMDTDVAEAEILYQRYISFSGEDSLDAGKYTVLKDGSVNDNYNDTTSFEVKTSTAKVRLTIGTYVLQSDTASYTLTVTKDGYTLEKQA